MTTRSHFSDRLAKRGLTLAREDEQGRFMHVFDVRGPVGSVTDDDLIADCSGSRECSYVRRYGFEQAVVYAWWD